jgi:hypothetical protein
MYVCVIQFLGSDSGQTLKGSSADEDLTFIMILVDFVRSLSERDVSGGTNSGRFLGGHKVGY